MERRRLRTRRAGAEARPPVDHRRVVSRLPRNGSRHVRATRGSRRSFTSASFPFASTPIAVPDINERYNLGGWPTTAFLTADGDLIGGGTFIAADRMPGILLRVAEAFASRAEEIAQARNRAPRAECALRIGRDRHTHRDDLLDVRRGIRRIRERTEVSAHGTASSRNGVVSRHRRRPVAADRGADSRRDG